MELLTIIYLTYSFIAFYFLFLFILLYLPHRKEIFSCPEPKKQPPLRIVVPCYNEEENIGNTIQALVNSDYKNLDKIIIVDDCSTDNSNKVIKRFADKYPKVMLVKTPKNTGRAGMAKNYGARFVNTELIGFADADSSPRKDAVSKMIGFFNNEKVSGVTPTILIKKRDKFIEKIQAIEYKIISFTRKLLGFVDAIYVTPGPLAIYRKKIFDKIGGFDGKNLTEDIEITWHFLAEGYKTELSAQSRVYTVAPNTFKGWLKQRIRWNVGGLQTINKYKKSFLKLGMLGSFVVPFFLSSWILGLCGFFILCYRIFRRILLQYLSTSYSIQAQTAILTLRDINLTGNVLIFFGLAIFTFSLFYTILALSYSREKEFKRQRIFHILIYLFVYLLAYPIILTTSIYKFFRGKRSW